MTVHQDAPVRLHDDRGREIVAEAAERRDHNATVSLSWIKCAIGHVADRAIVINYVDAARPSDQDLPVRL